jgi:hypothetical protein
MSLPEPVLRHTATPGFWADYLFEKGRPRAAYPELGEAPIELPVCPGYRLTLRLGRHLHPRLELVPPRPDGPASIGYDADIWGDSRPDALRWEELDLIGRCLALNDPSLPHPGLAVLLLNRLTPVCLDTDADAVFPLLESAWRLLGAAPQGLEERVECNDRRHAGLAWAEIEHVWALTQNAGAARLAGYHCSSLRSAGSPGFPFRQWAAFLEAAERHYASAACSSWLTANGGAAGMMARATAEAGGPDGAAVLADALEEAGCEHATVLDACRSGDPARFGWVVELLLGLPRGSVLRRLFGPTPHVRRTWHRFTIYWPESAGRSPLSPATGVAIAEEIEKALRAGGLVGRAGLDGTCGDGTHTAQLILTARVRDERERGIEVIRSALLALDAPAGLRWQQDAPERRQVPLRPQ